MKNYTTLFLGVMFVLLIGLLVPGQPSWAKPVESVLGNQSGDSQTTPQLIEAARQAGEIDQETADLYLAYALSGNQNLPEQYRSYQPWDGTLPILHLRRAMKTMQPGATRATVQAVLAGACDTESSGSLPNSMLTTNFYIEYGSLGAVLTINDFVDALEGSWAKEVDDSGWAAPPAYTPNPPPGGRYHVRIDSLLWGEYGYTSPVGAHAGLVGDNPNTLWDDQDAYASCIVLDDNFSFSLNPEAALVSTVAHEFNHAIQFGYGALEGSYVPDDALVEGMATWMEDEVFDDSNDNYYFLWPNFAMCMGQYTSDPYAYWITFRGLTEQFGAGVAGGSEQVMQDFWELVSQDAGDGLAVLNTALSNRGSNLADAFHVYAVAVKFNKACGGGYVYPHCLEEGPGYVAEAGATNLTGSIASVGGSYSKSIPDNYAINWVGLPANAGWYNVRLRNTSTTGGMLRGSVVCDAGNTLEVYALPSLVGPSGSSTLNYFNSTGCNSVVAVLTNQSQTADNPGSCTARNYQLSLTSASALDQTRLPVLFKP
ncbi:MAG: hypothetical protein AB1894_01805 [Chloroflexota bacterium]